MTLDPSSGRMTIAAARARELRGRRPTGRVFADVELVGDLGILATMTAASREREELAVRDEQEGLPRWRSARQPASPTAPSASAGRRSSCSISRVRRGMPWAAPRSWPSSS
ncbi:MAG: hypothetical protein NT062_38500, partial [Proteobacteria bacterium]|nr:hypothetical protein [Pseudomonadota bacterium]